MNHKFFALAIAALALSGCSLSEIQPDIKPAEDKVPISLGSHINQEYATRAGQDGFADGDKIATYIVKPAKAPLRDHRES